MGTTEQEGIAFIYSILDSPLDELEYIVGLEAVFGLFAGTKIIKYYPIPEGEGGDTRPTLSTLVTHKV